MYFLRLCGTIISPSTRITNPTNKFGPFIPPFKIQIIEIAKKETMINGITKGLKTPLTLTK